MRFKLVTPSDNLLEVCEALRPVAYQAGEHGDVETLRTWAGLNQTAQAGCGGRCGRDKSACTHCQPVGAERIGDVQRLLNQCSQTVNPSPLPYFNGVPYSVGMKRFLAAQEKSK
jgi:hypothetical protein